MSQDLNNVQEAALPIDDVAKAKQIDNIQKEKPLSKLSRTLTEEDFKSPGVRKMLIGQVDEYEACKAELNTVRTSFHNKDKEAAVLKERLSSFQSFDWLFTALTCVGSILIGYYASQPEQGIVLLILGIICVAVAFIIRWRRSK